jgi:CPA2 family monovalent cation:H+ antiporter-2
MSAGNISLIQTFLLLFGAALTGGIIARKLRQPMLLGYIGAGIVLGNLFPRFLDTNFLEMMADIGVTLLLFTLGVEFSFQRLKHVLGTVSWAAIVQILLCFFLFIVLLLFLGFPFVTSLFIAIAASLSSTAVVVKILSDRGELDTIPGEIMTAWLIVQDLAVVPIMIILPAVTQLASNPTTFQSGGYIFLTSFVKAIVVLALIIFLGKYGIGKVLSKVASYGSREIFLIATIGIVFLAGLATYSIGLSAALGAFIAGLLIAETSQNHAIFAEIRPLRDIFSVVFFTSLGMVLPIATIMPLLPQIIGLTLGIVLVKFFVVYVLSRFLAFHRKTAFLVALALTQMSEFGFIIGHEGKLVGALSQHQYVLLSSVTFLTILVSAPLFAQGSKLYYALQKSFGRFLPMLFPVKGEITVNDAELSLTNHVVICGYGRVGKYVGRALELSHVPYIVIDYNQSTVLSLKQKGIPALFGDPADKTVLDHAQVDFAKAVVIAIPDKHTQELIITNTKTLNKKVTIICRTHHEEDQQHLKALGVTTVVQPEFTASLLIAEKLLSSFGVSGEEITGKMSRLKIEHGVG